MKKIKVGDRISGEHFVLGKFKNRKVYAVNSNINSNDVIVQSKKHGWDTSTHDNTFNYYSLNPKKKYYWVCLKLIKNLKVTSGPKTK